MRTLDDDFRCSDVDRAHLVSQSIDRRSLPWEMLDQEVAAQWLPTLKAGLRGAHRFVAMIEAIAEGPRPRELRCLRGAFLTGLNSTHSTESLRLMQNVV
jgi:hypothetical protein